MSTCTIHPTRTALEGSDPPVCLACFLGAGTSDSVTDTDPFEGWEVVAFSAGAPCRCGPGFCASQEGLGYYGYCNGSREAVAVAEPCPVCLARNQSTAGCWNCSRCGADDVVRPSEYGLRHTYHRESGTEFDGRPNGPWIQIESTLEGWTPTMIREAILDLRAKPLSQPGDTREALVRLHRIARSHQLQPSTTPDPEGS